MKRIFNYTLGLVALPVLFNSCATYTMSREQLYTTLTSATQEEVTTVYPGMMRSQVYWANGVAEIACTDKKGNPAMLMNSPQIEMRITDTNGHRRVFYFDTVHLKDSVFTGSISRMLNIYRSIHYAKIKKVEVQNGRKAFHYASGS